nr:hypothetical protein [Tanacetum cinerariifolium]
MAPLPPANQRPVNQVYVLDFSGLTPKMRHDLVVRLRMEMAEAGFKTYWVGSDRFIPDKGYWIEISSGRDFLGPAPFYVLIQDPAAAVGAHEDDEAGSAAEEVTKEIPEPAQAPPPPPQPQTMSIDICNHKHVPVSQTKNLPFIPGPFVIDSITLPAWCINNENSNINCWLPFSKILIVIFRVTKSNKDSKKGVNNCTDASGSKPRSNIKKNRISSAKSVNKKIVEEQPRTNKSSLKKVNRVDSSISSKHIGHPQQALKNKEIVDSGCSKHMTGNKAYLAYYQEISDGGFVAFGSSRGKITGKGKATQRDELSILMSQEKEASDAADALRKEFKQGCMDQRGATKAGNTNSFNIVSNPVNTASTLGTFSAGGPSSPHPDAFISANTLLHVDQNDSQIPNLEDTVELRCIDIFNNHPKDQILRDPKLAVQTKGMSKKSSEAHAFVSYIHTQRRTNHKDYENYLFACFLSHMEPKKVAQSLDDEN